MRLGRVLSSALLMAVMGATGAWAELSINGPADVPPASFTGRQYVDSAGCVFVRAGYGDAVRWVPRVTRDRKQLCGYKPTLALGAPVLDVARSAPAAPAKPAVKPVAAKPVTVAAAPVAAPRPAVTTPFAPTPGVGRPMATIASTTTPPRIGLAAARPVAPMPPVPAAPPVAAVSAPTAPAGRYVSPYALDGAPAPVVNSPAPVAVAAAPVTIVRVETVAGGVTACPNLSPVAQRYMLSDGRRVVRCGPQTDDPAGFINSAGLPGLRVAGAPVPAVAPRAMPMAAPAPVGMTPQQAYAATSPYAVPQKVYVRNPATGTTTLTPVTVSTKSPTGAYRPAFEDGRLNPYRGPRGAMGDAMQGQIWTNQVPARLVAAQTSAPQGQQVLAQARVSSKSLPHIKASAPISVPQAAGARFVQVGSFGVPANAEGAKARLRALGLPVSTGRAGKLVVVYAGPLRGADAPAALARARAAGFGDAILR